MSSPVASLPSSRASHYTGAVSKANANARNTGWFFTRATTCVTFAIEHPVTQVLSLKQTGKLQSTLPVILLGKKYWQTVISWDVRCKIKLMQKYIRELKTLTLFSARSSSFSRLLLIYYSFALAIVHSTFQPRR